MNDIPTVRQAAFARSALERLIAVEYRRNDWTRVGKAFPDSIEKEQCSPKSREKGRGGCPGILCGLNARENSLSRLLSLIGPGSLRQRPVSEGASIWWRSLRL